MILAAPRGRYGISRKDSRYEPDFDSLRDASTRIVVAGGIESEDTFPYRAALALAEQLGTDVVVFPSHHGGFHEQGDPEAFAATLRRVLTNTSTDQDSRPEAELASP